MLVDFEFATAGRIIAGPGRAAELPGAVAGLGSPVLVCTGAGRGVPGGRRAHGRVGPGGCRCAREHGADVVAAIGGGSVIDVGKTVAMLLGNGGDPLDYLEGCRVRSADHAASRAKRGRARHRWHRGGGHRQCCSRLPSARVKARTDAAHRRAAAPMLR